MYRLGEVFLIPVLCEAAVFLFNDDVPKDQWSQETLEDFCEAAKIAYSSTPPSNRGMRDAVTAISAGRINELLERSIFAKAFRDDFPELGTDIVVSLAASKRILPEERPPKRHKKN